MRRATTISILVLLLRSVPALPQQPIPNGAIEGTVVRADTGEPIVGAQVTLTSANITPLGVMPPGGAPAGAGAGGIVVPGAGGGGGGGGAGGGGGVFTPIAIPPGGTATALLSNPARPGGFQPVTTGADGRFSFKDLRAGTYRVAAISDGFVRQEYGQRSVSGQGRPIFLTAGQTVKDAAFRLTPTGTVSGRVFDENGQPATGAPVQLLRPVYNVQGRTYQVMGTGAADDRGDYRIYGVTPGRYYLLAGTPPGPNRPVNRGGGGPAGTARYDIAYFPAAASVEQASTVEVRAGAEASFDMRVSRQTRTYRVRGRIVDGTGTGVPANVNVMLGYRTFNGGGSFSTGRNYDPATGTFELQNVPPGDYTLQVQIPVPFDAPTAVFQASRPSAQTPIRVVDSDIEGVVLNLTSGVSVSGRFVVEGQPISVLPNIQQMSLAFSPAVSGPLAGPLPAGAPAAADGTFQVAGLREGEYRVNLRGGPGLAQTSGFYIKSIQYGGEDILSKPFKFSGSGSGTIEVTLRTGPGQIAGNVTDARSQPVPGIQVIAIPKERGRTTDYRTAIADQNGHYSLTGITPGDYQIFSWESLDALAQFDPDFLKQYEQQGKAVHVAEASSQNVDVKLIPAP